MIRITAIILLLYFLFGTLCLPRGNFAAITDLPEMYRHCKAYEDKDLSLFDFITDHLINIDGIFDKHDHGDEQKPHSPITFNQNAPQTIFCQFQLETGFLKYNTIRFKIPCYEQEDFDSGFFVRLFRPPKA